MLTEYVSEITEANIEGLEPELAMSKIMVFRKMHLKFQSSL